MVTIASGYSMITAKKALQMLKMKLTYGLPAAVFASVTPADSHKLVWAAPAVLCCMTSLRPCRW